MADLQIHANLAIAAGAVFIPVCTGCVGLRLYARRLHGVSLGADDWTVIAGLVFVIAMGVTLITEVGLKELGYPAPDPSTAVGKPNANIAFWPVEILQVPALGLVKVSFILLYRRIFTKRTAPIFHWVTLSLFSIIVSWTIAFFFSLVFICGNDFSAYWTSTIVEKAHCVDTDMLHNAFAISDVVTDVLIMILPLPMIWQLHLTTRRKLGICAIFGLGAFSVGASIVKMVIFIQATSVNYNPNADFECKLLLPYHIEPKLTSKTTCLPVQYGLMKSKAIQSIVRSVQSAISLRSLSSRGSGAQATKLSSQPSQEYIVSNAEGPANDGHILEMGRIPQEHGIVVTHSLEQAQSLKKG
ncbi:hypothetical protein MMC28_007160 [Mycoblastus sanguinarius]|nr:hypothetical protein [Mycoblastus sanguinarius]